VVLIERVRVKWNSTMDTNETFTASDKKHSHLRGCMLLHLIRNHTTIGSKECRVTFSLALYTYQGKPDC